MVYQKINIRKTQVFSIYIVTLSELSFLNGDVEYNVTKISPYTGEHYTLNYENLGLAELQFKEWTE